MSEKQLIPPPAQQLTSGDSLRMAVGKPTGPRSAAWVVTTGRNSPDIYIGTRRSMASFKVSLHASGRWRLAEAKSRFQSSTTDRVLERYSPPEEFAPGWRFAAQILVPVSSLRAPYDEAPPKGGEVSWWPAPIHGKTMSFNVFVGDAPLNLDVSIAGVGEVGRIALADGGALWLLADEIDSTNEEPALAVRRSEARGIAGSQADPRGELVAWAKEDTTGRVVIYDLGAPLG